MKSFWDTLPKPFFVMAPMADVTDPAYRRLIAEMAKPSVMFTEFVSADGLYHTREPRKDGTTIYSRDADNPLMRDLQYTESERPIVAQFFTGKPEMMEYAAALAVEFGFDGVDINMGCPIDTIEKQGTGAAHIKDPALAKEVIRAAKRGAAGKIPVSVKTRIGFNTEILDEWIPQLLEEELAALTLHLRTRKEMSKVEAHWDLMERAVEIRNRAGVQTLMLGNGDVRDLADAKDKAKETGADGIMLGRAIFGNPWVFAGRSAEDIPPRERLEALAKLAEYFSELSPPKHFSILKKHFKAFVNGWDRAAELRTKLMVTNTVEEFRVVLGNSGLL